MGVPPAPQPPPHPILQLQRSIGNQAVGRMLRPPRIQAKLRANPRADPYEQEADDLAAAAAPTRDQTAASSVFDRALAQGLALSASRPALSANGHIVQRAPASPDPARVTKSSKPLIVDDEIRELAPGQMSKSDFLARLQTAVCRVTEEALAGSGRTSTGCQSNSSPTPSRPWVST